MFKHGVLRGLRSVVEVEETPPLPHFPGRPDTMVTGEEQLEERRAQLENYLNQVLSLRCYRENPDMIDFLEVSRLSFTSGLAKGKEGWMKKRRGDDRATGLCHWAHCVRCQRTCCACLPSQWSRRFFLIPSLIIVPWYSTIIAGG